VKSAHGRDERDPAQVLALAAAIGNGFDDDHKLLGRMYHEGTGLGYHASAHTNFEEECSA
jgi:hypothetical protein